MSRQPQARAGKAKFPHRQPSTTSGARPRLPSQRKDVRLDTASSRVGSKIFEAEGICKRFGDKVILDDFTYTFAPAKSSAW